MPPMLTTMPLPLVLRLLRRVINVLPISLRNDLHQALIILGGGVDDPAPQADQHDVINLDHDLLHVNKQDVINLANDLGHVNIHDVINLDNDRHHVTLHDAIKDKSELLAASQGRGPSTKRLFFDVLLSKMPRNTAVFRCAAKRCFSTCFDQKRL